ncbi:MULTISPECIES: MTH1187 family thiamine-binding protein [Bacillaceae]|uniref:Thiamine-binding protein domain-containing protein n=1 Tax=Oceanobacillus caeni TaxID=405946 RepID=A0ABR5MLZ6_9BACI|nr:MULTISPECIES: thiamine-binding protein [Bacillaceae]KKE80456.1 hypothetical protein WH51_01725 [Bacilli bacterium VT-13-104]PZD83205.1 thiamine-binding protein [Bacilli bacterium]KPH77435.1 hypothetical protein AFL42_03415 [Oceanobacillus caeni]MBU8790701.1 thiamine-binding protein [Oceanobacillus caeni]MED4475360.1 thiamine-binding protein [Oceanobacillus caeni]
MANALLSIQMIPKAENGVDTYPLVDEAIKVIDESGVKYQVNPLETTMEGNLSELLQIVEKMNEKMVEKGCASAISQIKIFYKPDGASMDQLTEKYR